MRNEIRSAVISAISFCLLGGMGDGSITVDNDISVEGARVALARVGGPDAVRPEGRNFRMF